METQRKESDQGLVNEPQPAPAHRGFGERAAERQHAWHQRQCQARENADRLIESATASGKDCHAALADVARRAASLLEAARCDILLLDGTARAVRYRMTANARLHVPPVYGRPGTRDILTPTVSVQAVALRAGRSPLELLRSDGPINRIYAFMNPADDSAPIGILCVQSDAGNQLAIDERVFVDALADRLGAAIASGAFTGWRNARAAAREIV